MFYAQRGVRLRQRGSRAAGFYKLALALSLIANVLFAAGIWNKETIQTAIVRAQSFFNVLTPS